MQTAKQEWKDVYSLVRILKNRNQSIGGNHRFKESALKARCDAFTHYKKVDSNVIFRELINNKPLRENIDRKNRTLVLFGRPVKLFHY